MSITAMVGLGMERQRELTDVKAEVAAGGAKKKRRRKWSLESGMQEITAFIPSEVIGLYVAGLGIFSPVSSKGKWWVFGVCFALIPIFILLQYLRQKSHAPGRFRGGTAVILLCFALVAFVAWAAALPETPFLSLCTQATVFAGFCVLVLAAVLPEVADLLGVLPKRR